MKARSVQEILRPTQQDVSDDRKPNRSSHYPLELGVMVLVVLVFVIILFHFRGIKPSTEAHNPLGVTSKGELTTDAHPPEMGY